ncbi:hypothetical protein BURMUCGD2_3506 [Burkholderia multivorans CGD2]|uniref:Uncharacterized protein n=1 Tax=Burkholderia multivorans CGD2 TaxID=513052 RepID=B9BWH4_9BURK|nr:hypothetical protein BURMUCGD2_3506 [Burkholderia multivorans CGD2]
MARDARRGSRRIFARFEPLAPFQRFKRKQRCEMSCFV